MQSDSQPGEQSRQPLDDVRPTTLEFYIGPLDCGDWFEVKYVDGHIDFRSGGPVPEHVRRTIRCAPDREHWLQFWKNLDRLGVWDWKQDYSNPYVLDGGYWRLNIEYAGRKLTSGGDNGYPETDETWFPPGGTFDQLLVALEDLTGIYGRWNDVSSGD